MAISTFDTRASSVVLALRPGFLDGGHLHTASYNANFSATTGNLSAQFGLHYLNLREREGEPVLHGAAGSAVALFSLPTGERFDNGIPGSAVAFYLGSLPTAFFGGPRNHMTIWCAQSCS